MYFYLLYIFNHSDNIKLYRADLELKNASMNEWKRQCQEQTERVKFLGLDKFF
jgi:hypothetical protein